MISAESANRSDRTMRAFFLDSENGAARLLEGMELLTRSDLVVVFHRDNFPFEVKSKLELAPCSIEWVKCVDPGVKNSMDVQIIADLAMRLATDGFRSAYILSEDKGYLPAVHYLQQTKKGEGCDIALVKNVVHASARAIFSTLAALKSSKSVEDVEWALSPMFGEDESRSIVEGLEKVFARSIVNAEGAIDDVVAKLQDVSAEEIVLCTEREALSDGPSFVGLPGIGRALAGKLENAGVTNPAELARIGAVGAWISIYRIDASFPPKWVYSFEAAIEGVPVQAIDSETKKRLKGDVRAFLAGRQHAA